MKYHAKITGWGKGALSLLEDPETNFIVIFKEGVPPELAEISVLHEEALLLGEPAAGDMVAVADKVFTITAVGDEASRSLREMGHCTLAFNGAKKPDRPGCIMLEGDEKLSASDIKVGAAIEIY